MTIRAGGYPIQIVPEDAFLHRLGLVDYEASIHRRYTIVQLSRILNVPRDRVRAWMRAGLIEPVEVVHRLPLFDFHQVASAKTLCELVAAGLTPQRIREGLERLRQWFSEVDRPLEQVTTIEGRGRFLIRLSDGQLAEPSGQLQLDFEPLPDDTYSMLSHHGAKTADECFERAVELETEGRMNDAAVVYLEAI